MVALLDFIMATVWRQFLAEKKLLDAKGSFDVNFLKNPARYVT